MKKKGQSNPVKRGSAKPLESRGKLRNLGWQIGGKRPIKKGVQGRQGGAPKTLGKTRRRTKGSIKEAFVSKTAERELLQSKPDEGFDCL